MWLSGPLVAGSRGHSGQVFRWDGAVALGTTEDGVWGGRPEEKHGGEDTGVRSGRDGCVLGALAGGGIHVPQTGSVGHTLGTWSQCKCRWDGAWFAARAAVRRGPVLQRATQISTVPFVDESSGSDDDCSSQASFRTSVPCSESRKTSGLGSPRAIKRGMEKGSRKGCRTTRDPSPPPTGSHSWW